MRYESPKGIAHFPALIRPDTKFNPDGTYKTGLIISAEEYEKVKELCEEAFKEEFGSGKKKKPLSAAQWPFKKLEPAEGEDDNDEYILSFSTKNKPKFFDSKGNPIKNLKAIEKLGGGSKLRLKGSIAAYEAGGKVGVKIYLNEVQVIKLVEYNGGGFKADDEEEDAFDASACVAGEDDGDSRPNPPADDEDPIDF